MHRELAAIFGDTQIPYHSPRALNSVLWFLRDQADVLTHVYIMGDWVDLAGLSVKFLRYPEDRYRVRQEFETAWDYLKTIRNILPHAKITYIAGNHEERLRVYLATHADELSWMADGNGPLSISGLLNLEDLDITYVEPYGAGTHFHSLFLTHGSRVSPHSAYAARLEYTDHGTSGASGHTHRGGVHYHTDMSGAHAWFETFCLCNTDSTEGDLPPGYRNVGVRNQQQGLVVLDWLDDGSEMGIWAGYPLAMVNQRFVWNGKLYTPEGVRSSVVYTATA